MLTYLLDMDMPIMNGEQPYAEWRKIAPEIKVIVSSSISEIEIATRFDPHPLPTLLRKPYTMEDLFMTVQKTVSITQQGHNIQI